MDDAKVYGNRRDFLGLAATAAAAGLGAMVPVAGNKEICYTTAFPKSSI